MNLKPVLGLVIGASAVATAIILSGSSMPAIVLLWSIPSIVLLCLGALIAGPGVSAIAQVFTAARGELSRRGMNGALETLTTASKALGVAALLGFLVNFLDMMKNLSEPKEVWIHLAWALAPAFFALILKALVILPLKNAVQTAVPGTKEVERGQHSNSRCMLGTLISLAGLFLFNSSAFMGFLLLDYASMAIALFVPIAMIMAGGKAGSIRTALATLKDGTARRNQLETAVASLSFVGSAIRYGGYLGAATGFLFMVKDWTERMRTGPTLALAVISALYASILYAVFALPLIGEAKRRLALAE